MEILLKQINNDFDESLLDFLSDLDKEEFDINIFKLIYTCYINNNIESAVKIIDFCEVARINIDPLPTITGFFLNDFFNIDLLKWTTSLFSKESTGYYLDIINFRNDEEAVTIAEKLLVIFPNITEEEWTQLSELTEDFEDEEYENFEFRNFLLSQTNNFATLPNWIIEDNYLVLLSNKNTVEGDYPLLLSDKRSVEGNYPLLPNVEDAVEMILEDFRKLNIGFAEINDDDDDDEENNKNIVKENLTVQYAISTSQEKIDMLSNIINIPSFDDSYIFKEYGPVNSSYSCSLVIEKNHECLKYGGCRMLLCNEYPEKDIFGEQIDLTAKTVIVTDWFKNKCNECGKKIRQKNHALRLPLYYGGWQGCYCSFECLEKKVDNTITALAVGRMKSQMYSIGIND